MMIKRIWAKLTGGRLVWLKDMHGKVTLAIAYRDPWGELTAEVYWPWSIRVVVLSEGGQIENGSYVKLWRYVDDDRRLGHNPDPTYPKPPAPPSPPHQRGD